MDKLVPGSNRGLPGAGTVATAVGQRREAEGYARSRRVTAGRILGISKHAMSIRF